LYGLVAGDHELSAWLVEQGFAPETLRAEILELHGYVSGPLDCDVLAADSSPDESPEQSTLPEVANAPPPIPGPISATRRRPRYRPLAGGAGALRVLDAAANRAREALRVAEDYVRFVLDDRHLTERLKCMRHHLAATLAVIEGPERYACRETQGDVGTALTTPSEQSRVDVEAVLTTSFKRLGESLRSLEEFGKTIDAEFAATIEQIRYEAYTIEAAVHGTRHSLQRLADARLYVLIDGGESEAAFVARVDELVRAGVDAIQLRDKRLADRELIARARR
jgi:thiamine-phosphate pyrophosphorylase